MSGRWSRGTKPRGRARATRTWLIAAAGTRAFATGMTGVLLGLYLGYQGLEPTLVGLVIGAGLAGNAVGTAAVTVVGDRLSRHAQLIGMALLAAAGLCAVALANRAGAMAGAALIGMVNGAGRDRGPAQVLEQSLLADAAAQADQTPLFVRYTLVQDVMGALGALAAGAPELVTRTLDPLGATRGGLLAASAITLATAALYLRLPGVPPLPSSDAPRSSGAPAIAMRWRRIRRLIALFALDSLGGGFVTGSILSYWFFLRFDLDAAALGAMFFAARILNAVSYVAAGRLAARWGLVRTMVFTHLPSSALLCAVPFAPTAGLAIVLFLLREALVQMDVPTRQAYVAAVTPPGERAFALGATGLVRNVGWAFGPALSGITIAAWGLTAPLLIGAGLKIIYDLALYASYGEPRPRGGTDPP